MTTALDNLLLENARLRQQVASRDELIDYYVDHWQREQHIDTTRKFKQLQEDIKNADTFIRSEDDR